MAENRKCLLIVDDTEIDRIILKSILARDFEILEASNGNVAFEYITTKGNQLDAILLDIAMPDIDGFTRLLLQDTDFCEGLSENEIENIAQASILHDVGKITIPDAVLCKPGKLTRQEYELMKTHTVQGVTILKSVPQLRDSAIYDYACDIARHHHERWDGRGYPDGLVGGQISPWAQIVALADVYDALSCKRVYKDPFPRDEVIEMIVTGQCGQFNPRLLECFLSVEGKLFDLYRALLGCGVQPA